MRLSNELITKSITADQSLMKVAISCGPNCYQLQPKHINDTSPFKRSAPPCMQPLPFSLVHPPFLRDECTHIRSKDKLLYLWRMLSACPSLSFIRGRIQTLRYRLRPINIPDMCFLNAAAGLGQMG